MLNPSDGHAGDRATVADLAHFLRGGLAFGAVPFREGRALTPGDVKLDPGYADCLPILGGGY